MIAAFTAMAAAGCTTRNRGGGLGGGVFVAWRAPFAAAAILYSVNSMATRGASELMLQPHWQMMGALEAADGMLLFGISTAFIFTVMQFYYQHLVLQATRPVQLKPISPTNRPADA